MLESISSTQAAPGCCSRKKPVNKEHKLEIGLCHVCDFQYQRLQGRTKSRNLLLQNVNCTCVCSCTCAGAAIQMQCHRPSSAGSAALESCSLHFWSFSGNPSHPPKTENTCGLQPGPLGGSLVIVLC